MDEKLNETPQNEFQEMKSQVTQLEDRWMRFKRKLVELAEDNQRVVKRQTEFDQEHVKICSVLETVLRGTENTSLDQTDMAVDLERVEVSVIPQGLRGGVGGQVSQKRIIIRTRLQNSPISANLMAEIFKT